MPNPEVLDLQESDEDDVYETQRSYSPTKVSEDDLWDDNEEKGFQGKEKQARVQHATKGERHLAKEGPQQALEKEKITRV